MSIVSIAYAIRHPFKAADLALWERRNRREARTHGGEDFGRERDAWRVLAVLERDGGGMFTISDICESLHGTMTRTRVTDALQLLIGRGDVFCVQEGTATHAWITYGATEFSESERARGDVEPDRPPR